MSHRYTQGGSVAVLLAFVSISFRPAHAQQVPSAPPVAAAPAPAPAGLTLNVAGVPPPKKGEAYRFSLCTGEVLAADSVSRPCNPADAKRTVSGTAQNLPIVFRLGPTSFLPPGFTLDGNGVIAGTPGADLSKLKSVRICAIQLGAFGSNFACQGQEVNFKKLTINTPQPAQVVKSGGGSGAGTALKVGVGVGGAAAAIIVLKNAIGDLNDVQAANATSSTTTTAPAATGSRFAGTYDFSYVSPLGPQSLTRYWTVRSDGSIVSSEGAVSGTVNDAGTVRFTAPCWTNSGGTATWTGTLTVGSVKSGSGSFTCALNNINGGTWRVDNGR
jgi:hypothetical protein